MPGFDLNAIMQQAALANNQQAEGAQQIAGLSEQASGVAKAAADNIRTSGKYAAEAERTELEYELQTQSQRLGLANAFGTNQGAASDVITGLGQQMRQTGLQLIQQQAVVSEIEANSDLLGNPVGWLRDFLQGDGERAKLGALTNQFNSIAQVNQNLNAATQQGVQTQNAIKQTVTQESIGQLVTAKVAAAEAQASQQELEAIKYQIQGVNQLSNIGAEQFQRNMQVYNAGLQAEQIADAREDRKLRLQQFRKEVKDAESESAYYVGVTDRIKKAAALTGRAEINLDAAEVQRTYKSGGPRAALFQELEQIGFGLQEQGGSAVGLLGKDPFEASVKFAQLGGKADAAWSSGSQKIIERAVSIAGEELRKQQAKGIKITPEAQKAAVNAAVGAQVTAGATNVSQARDDYNSLPNLTTIISAKDKVLSPAGKLFAETVATDLVASGNDNPEAELVLATGVKLVQQGKLTQKQWKEGMLNFYQAGLGLKAATGGYTAFALPTPDSYRIKANRIVGDTSWANKILNITPIGIAAEFGTGITEQIVGSEGPATSFDLLDAADYDSLFTILMSKDRANKIREGAQ
ncbi:hypothetical protein D3C80_129240 [compost metagenome]